MAISIDKANELEAEKELQRTALTNHKIDLSNVPFTEWHNKLREKKGLPSTPYTSAGSDIEANASNVENCKQLMKQTLIDCGVENVASTPYNKYHESISKVVFKIKRRYGVKFYGSSTTGTRLFDAVGKNVQIASSVDEIVPNDFDTDEWFKDITYEIVDGNYVTRFPMCYGKMDFANQEFVIANDSFDGLYDVLPFFKAPDRSILPYNDVGRFQLGADYKSKPNVAWLAKETRSQFRSGVRGLGNQYSQWDIATITFVRALFMIVLANRNSQQILPCNTSGSKRNTGDTLNAKSSIVQIGNTAGSFYGLENIVDGGYYFIDGINCNDPYYYVCNDPSKYADNTFSGYTQITNFTEPPSSQYITKMDIDPKAPYAGLPSQASGGSDSTYYCDKHYKLSGWRIMYTGGYWSLVTYKGLFLSYCFDDSSNADSSIGSRLVRRPF